MTSSMPSERSKSPKPDYISIVKDDLSTSQTSEYVIVSASGKKDKMESEEEHSGYVELEDIPVHIEEEKKDHTSTFPPSDENTESKKPTQIVPPTMVCMENKDTNPPIGEAPCDEPIKGYKMRPKDDDDKRCFKVWIVLVIIIIIGLATAVVVLVYIVLEKKDPQSSEPSQAVIFTTRSPTDTMNTSTSAIPKTKENDETKSTANEALTSGKKTSITSVVTTTTPVPSTSTSNIPMTSTVKVPGYPKDCKEIRDSNITETNVYTIYPSSRTQAVKVMCDMSRNNGGWTVIQRRFDGSVDFYRVWKSYKNGFGNVTGEHWLGNDIIHQLTELGESFLYFVLEDFDGKEYVAEYSNFTVADESDQYRFRISEFIDGNAICIGGRENPVTMYPRRDYYLPQVTGKLSHITSANAIEGWENNNANGIQFSTHDHDNDNAEFSCAVARHGAWWYNECTMTNLNGRYPVDGGVCHDCNFWIPIFNDYIGMKKTMMMVRRK